MQMPYITNCNDFLAAQVVQQLIAHQQDESFFQKHYFDEVVTNKAKDIMRTDLLDLLHGALPERFPSGSRLSIHNAFLGFYNASGKNITSRIATVDFCI